MEDEEGEVRTQVPTYDMIFIIILVTLDANRY